MIRDKTIGRWTVARLARSRSRSGIVLMDEYAVHVSEPAFDVVAVERGRMTVRCAALREGLAARMLR